MKNRLAILAAAVLVLVLSLFSCAPLPPFAVAYDPAGGLTVTVHPDTPLSK